MFLGALGRGRGRGRAGHDLGAPGTEVEGLEGGQTTETYSFQGLAPKLIPSFLLFLRKRAGQAGQSATLHTRPAYPLPCLPCCGVPLPPALCWPGFTCEVKENAMK